jgi:hypothetical protein
VQDGGKWDGKWTAYRDVPYQGRRRCRSRCRRSCASGIFARSESRPYFRSGRAFAASAAVSGARHPPDAAAAAVAAAADDDDDDADDGRVAEQIPGRLPTRRTRYSRRR